MKRELVLKVVLVVVGLLFTAAIIPGTWMLLRWDQSNSGDAMMLSLYVTLGIMLLLALRNPSAHRSLIAFAAWSSFAHGFVMAVMAYKAPSERVGALVAVAVLAAIGITLLALAPAKQSAKASAAGA